MTQGNLGIAPTVDVPADRPGDTLHRAPSFSPEMQLLLCCGGPRIRASSTERMHRLVREDIDWELVFKFAMWHHMLPLLYWNLSQPDGDRGGIPVPASAMEAFRNAYVRNVGQALRMTGDLLAILEKMEEANVLAVPYKGPVLSFWLYGNLGLRRSVDLDIIVKKEDLQTARNTLIDLGYVPSIMLHSTNHEFQVESRYSERFDRPGGIVELHWAFTNRDVAFPLTLNDLMPSLVTCQVSGRSIRVIAPDDMLLILCVHGAKHGWARLEWICGVAELLHSEQIAWPDLVSRATKTRSLRRLFLGLCLARDLFHVPLPKEIEERIREDRQVTALAAAVSAELFTHVTGGLHSFGTLDHDIFQFRLGDRIPDSLRYLLYRMTTPSRPEKWSTISVGKRSVSLHSFTRPFGIIGKLVPAVWRRYGASRLSKRGNPSE